MKIWLLKDEIAVFCLFLILRMEILNWASSKYTFRSNLEQDEDLFAFYNVDLLGILFKLILSFY